MPNEKQGGGEREREREEISLWWRTVFCNYYIYRLRVGELVQKRAQEPNQQWLTAALHWPSRNVTFDQVESTDSRGYKQLFCLTHLILKSEGIPRGEFHEHKYRNGRGVDYFFFSLWASGVDSHWE
jgi:hypothetical protein